MSAVPSALPSPQSIKVGQVVIQGRLLHVRKAGQYFEHLVVMPAPDAYSSPATVAVLASKRLGDKEADLRILCRVTGYRRNYKTTDQETGEQRPVQTADNKLFALED